jgi:ketosteroid isomerase-like protein
MSTALDVGRQLVDLCRQGRHLDAVNTLYAPEVVSVEAFGDAHMPQRMEGIDAIRRKNQWWIDNHTIHGGDVEGPYPNGDRFVVRFRYDATPTSGPRAGQRMKMEEAALYTVRDGKVVQEEFFYHMG